MRARATGFHGYIAEDRATVDFYVFIPLETRTRFPRPRPQRRSKSVADPVDRHNNITVVIRVRYALKRNTYLKKTCVVFHRRKAPCLRGVQQGFLDVQLVEHSPTDSQWRKTAPVRRVWKTVHGQFQSLLSQNDSHQGKQRYVS